MLLFAAAVSAADEDSKKDEFRPLWNGKDLKDFDIVGTPASSWSVEEGVIKCTGKPNGYIVTRKSYRNYVLRIELRYPTKPGNSGFLIHCTGKPKVFPTSIEVQGAYSGLGTIFPIGGAKGPRPKVDSAARKKALKKHDEWNTVEITVQDGTISVKINGVKVCQSEAYELKEGPIGFQSEGAPIEFRNLTIKQIKPKSGDTPSDNSAGAEHNVLSEDEK
jgi:hypothetical protein